MAETYYRAKKPLHIGFARAHNSGDLVSAAQVEKYGWQEQVEKVSAAEAKTASTAPKSEK